MLLTSKSEDHFCTASALLRSKYHNAVHKYTGYPAEKFIYCFLKITFS